MVRLNRYAVIVLFLVCLARSLSPVAGRPVLSPIEPLEEEELALLRLAATNGTKFVLPESHLTWDVWDMHCTKTELECAPASSDTAFFTNCSYRSSDGCNLLVLGLEEVVDLTNTKEYNLTVNVMRSGSTYFYCYSGHIACEYATGRMAIRYYYDTCAGSLEHCVRLNATI
jgi:hypothetical protein